MAEEWVDIGDELVDCSTISIAYQANGLASISFTIYKKQGEPAPYSTAGGGGLNFCAGMVRFKGWIQQVDKTPNTEIAGDEYRVSAVAIGCRDDTCSQVC